MTSPAAQHSSRTTDPRRPGRAADPSRAVGAETHRAAGADPSRGGRWLLPVAAALLAGCTSDAGLPPVEPEIPQVVTTAPDGPLVLPGRTATELSIAASRAVWQSSPAAVTVAEADPAIVAQAAEQARDLGLPLFAVDPQAASGSAPASPSAGSPSPASPGADAPSPTGAAPSPASPGAGSPSPAAAAPTEAPTSAAGPSGSAPGGATGSAPGGTGSAPAATGSAGAAATQGSSQASTSPEAGTLAGELSRLGVTHVLHVGAGATPIEGVTAVSSASDLPKYERAEPLADLTALTAPRAARKGQSGAALGSLAAAGVEQRELSDTDPRATAADVEALKGTDPARVIGVGSGFGSTETFTGRLETAATGVQLPGGGQTIFDDKRYVALYGSPVTNALGILGEQGPTESVDRARRVAAGYEAHAQEKIVPAFEIIATVASGDAGKDGNYSNEWDADVLRPLVAEAKKSGVYVILDLQSGRDDFVTQAKLYEELLREPHVGLALDPEWRLQPGQRPLGQIGRTSAKEINDTTAWLADLTARLDLPQKMVLLHQFRVDMIPDREDIDLSHDELAVLVQMDGDGTKGQKMSTWRALLADAPKGLRFGWKNFYDEDQPTLSPQQTFAVSPKPWWVSYQ